MLRKRPQVLGADLNRSESARLWAHCFNGSTPWR